jgi:hypothetical protein
MIRSEPTIHDVDVAVDARIADETAAVDWDAVTTSEASAFGLALGLYRDVLHTYEKRRVAWGTATGGVISMSVLALACILMHAGPWFALSVVLGTQTLRALWLYLKAHQSRRDVKALEEQALDYAKELAAIHPSKQ